MPAGTGNAIISPPLKDMNRACVLGSGSREVRRPRTALSCIVGPNDVRV